MKAGILESIGHLVVREVPDPQLEEGSVLVRVRACSICGTDLRVYRHGDPRVELPHVLGHETAGEIVAADASVQGHRVGERVAITPRISCGECFYCLRGQSIYCENRLTFGFQVPGGYEEYMLVPPRGIQSGVLNELADSLNFEEGALAEPLSCCLRAQRVSRVASGDTVVVVGGGPIGIMHCRLARANRAGRVLLVERDASRLTQVDLSAVDEVVDSSRGGAEDRLLDLTQGRGADVVIVAVSSAEAQEESLSFAGRGSRVNFFAGLAPGEPRISIDSNVVHYREVSLQGSHGSTPEDSRKALNLLATKALKIGDLITHRFPLDSIEEAFLFAEGKKGMHVAILP